MRLDRRSFLTRSASLAGSAFAGGALAGSAIAGSMALTGCAPWLDPTVPVGPPVAIALGVSFFVDVVGTFLTDGFASSLADSLAAYDLHVVPRAESPDLRAIITLGAWSDLSARGRSIEFLLDRRGERMLAGRMYVPDFDMTTLDAAAPYGAAIIARALRS